jgi:hypothetical protein
MAGNGTGPRPVIPDRTTFVVSGTMSKTIACCNDEPAPHSSSTSSWAAAAWRI